LKTRFTSPLTVLNLDPVEDDQACLSEILSPCDWRLTSTATAEKALEMLQMDRIPILFCESDLHPGRWQQVLEQVMGLPDPPYMIVTSRLADDRLWAEALNLGAYDVLSKPFDRSEVTRIVRSAWTRWSDRQRPRAAVA
jgi:CheY-like chemotaxis protein